MVVLKPQAELGHAPPPQTPYSLITNLVQLVVELLDERKLFDKACEMQANKGDAAVLGRLVHIYPRFAPTHYGREVSSLLPSPPHLPLCIVMFPTWLTYRGHV